MKIRYHSNVCSLIVSIVILFSFMTVIAAPQLLIQIPIRDINEISLLKDLPVEINLRTDTYVIANINKEQVNMLDARGIAYDIVDETPWSEPYYVISGPRSQDLSHLPKTCKIVVKTDRDAIVKATEETAEELRKTGLDVFRLSQKSLPLRVDDQRNLQQLDIRSLRDPVVEALINRVSESSLAAALQRLQDFQTRWSGSDSVHAAGQWLYNQFKSFGYQDVVFDTLDFFVEGQLQHNIIVTKPGTTHPDKIVMIGGHYDSIVLDGTNPLVWAPGVDDNGTGTVAALEAARVLVDVDFEKTIIFACWASEEQGLLGSNYWAAKASQANLDIELYINFDMIANVNPNDPVRDINIATSQSSRGFGELMNELALSYTTLVPRLINASTGGSDHSPFMQRGYNIVYGEEGDFSPNWHRYTDTMENVNIPYYREVVQIGIGTLAQVAGPPATISGSYIAYAHSTFDDDDDGLSIGNNNGYLDPGETVELYIQIKNVGDAQGTNVQAKLQTDDPFVTIMNAQKSFGDIASGDSATNFEAFVFSISPQTPNDHSIIFSLAAQDEGGGLWDSHFMLKTRLPELYYSRYRVEEISGDGDNIPEPGEICNLFVTIENQGLRLAQGIQATLATTDPDIVLVDSETTFPDTEVNSKVDNVADPFTFLIQEDALLHLVQLNVNLSEGQGFYQKQMEVAILLGQEPVLLVVDDGEANNSQPYMEALNHLGAPLTQWDVQIQGAPSVETLSEFSTAIWFTGSDASETLTDADQANIQNFLEAGGNLLLSGDFLGLRLFRSSFYSDYLHAKFISNQTQIHSLQSAQGNAVTDLNMTLSQSSWPSEIDPIAPAFSVLEFDTTTAEGIGGIRSSGTAALAVDTGLYKLVYCSFGVESILSTPKRAMFLEDVLSWFKGSPIDMRAILSLGDISIDDDSTDQSLGDGDGFINPGEQVELSIKVVNSGVLAAQEVQAVLRTDDPWVTVIDSTATFDTAPEKDTTSTDDNFVFIVDRAAPHKHEVLGEVHLRDAKGSSWINTFSLTIILSNTISGLVTDVSTGQGISGAEVWYNDITVPIGGEAQFGNVETNESGNYSLSLPISTYELAVVAQGYVLSEPVQITLPPDTVINFIMTAPEIAVTPDSIVVDVDVDGAFRDTLIISNVRSGQLYYSIFEEPSDGAGMLSASLKNMPIRAQLPLLLPTTATPANLQAEASSTPDPNGWRLVHEDPDEIDVNRDLARLYMQNDGRNIFFKQTFYQPWNNPNSDLIYMIFIDSDLDTTTGASINNIGANYAIALGSLGNYILQWLGPRRGFDVIGGNPAPQHIIFRPHSDSLEVGIRLAQIGNSRRMNLVVITMSPSQITEDVAPHNGLYHIPYSTYNANWLMESTFYGMVESASSDTVFLNFSASGLDAGSYATTVIIANNQPDGAPQIIPIRFNVGTTLVNGNENYPVPTTYALLQNYPNPFSVSQIGKKGTTIKYQLPRPEEVTLKVYNMLGQEVITLVHGRKKSGYFLVNWDGQLSDGQPVTSGIYLYRIQAGEFVQTRKLLIMR